MQRSQLEIRYAVHCSDVNSVFNTTCSTFWKKSSADTTSCSLFVFFQFFSVPGAGVIARNSGVIGRHSGVIARMRFFLYFVSGNQHEKPFESDRFWL